LLVEGRPGKICRELAVARALDREGFKTAVGACGSDDARGLARALSRFDPACTPALARDVVERCLNDRSDAPLDTRLLEQWHALRPAVAAAANRETRRTMRIVSLVFGTA